MDLHLIQSSQIFSMKKMQLKCGYFISLIAVCHNGFLKKRRYESRNFYTVHTLIVVTRVIP